MGWRHLRCGVRDSARLAIIAASVAAGTMVAAASRPLAQVGPQGAPPGAAQGGIPSKSATSAPSFAPALAAPIPPGKGAITGQPVPRFVSVKSDRVHMRSGPGLEHAIQWVYNRAGLPLEVIAEVEAWRRVRDSEGAVGWVLASLLSARRTALVEPWAHRAGGLQPGTQKPAQPPLVALRTEARESSSSVVQVEAGVIASVRGCDGRWCEITVADFRGYLEQHRLWGVYKGENVR